MTNDGIGSDFGPMLDDQWQPTLPDQRRTGFGQELPVVNVSLAALDRAD